MNMITYIKINLARKHTLWLMEHKTQDYGLIAVWFDVGLINQHRMYIYIYIYIQEFVRKQKVEEMEVLMCVVGK